MKVQMTTHCQSGRQEEHPDLGNTAECGGRVVSTAECMARCSLSITTLSPAISDEQGQQHMCSAGQAIFPEVQVLHKRTND